MNVIFDLYHRPDPGRPPGGDELARLRHQVEDLQSRLDCLTLAAQAMWELIREQSRLSDAELASKMQEVDLRDGEADGRITASVVSCPGCGRRGRSNRRRCVYCGGELPPHHVFGH